MYAVPFVFAKESIILTVYADHTTQATRPGHVLFHVGPSVRSYFGSDPWGCNRWTSKLEMDFRILGYVNLLPLYSLLF